MELVNTALNGLAWYLWASAFVFPRYAVKSSQPLTLLSTLRAETPQSFGRVFALSGLLVLLGLRAVGYWNFSQDPFAHLSVDFGVLVVSFKTDSLAHMGLYSVGSFLVFLLIYYTWVVGLSVTNRQRARVDSIENLIDQQIGGIASWHPANKVGALFGVGVVLWIVFGILLHLASVLPEEWSPLAVIWQSPFVALSLTLWVAKVIFALIALHFLNSYVYLGEHPVWAYIDKTAKVYLTPFRRLPLVVGRFDFAPIVGFLFYWWLFGGLGLLSRLIFQRLPV